jgi:hypothetical protein
MNLCLLFNYCLEKNECMYVIGEVRVPNVPCNEEVDFSLRIVKCVMKLERKYFL